LLIKNDFIDTHSQRFFTAFDPEKREFLLQNQPPESPGFGLKAADFSPGFGPLLQGCFLNPNR
jgi:hypothetical protein